MLIVVTAFYSKHEQCHLANYLCKVTVHIYDTDHIVIID